MKLISDARLRDIKSLISDGKILNLKVNFYQRPYRWTAKKVTDLFGDYKENRESDFKRGNNLEYFIGAVVLVNENANDDYGIDNKVSNYQVIDGQQRFTTLFLFNYIKYMLLVRKVDEAARTKIATDFIAGLQSIHDCYRGFIGSNNESIILSANQSLSKAFDDANRNGTLIDKNCLNEWRKAVGWISDPVISSPDYYDYCCNAMNSFLKNERMRIHYQNEDFNDKFKNALSKIVFKFSNASDPFLCDVLSYEYIDDDVSNIEFPYVDRAYGIFEQIKTMDEEVNGKEGTPYEKLCRYICIIDEMLSNIKMCMIETCDEDDAYKLFESLNDRSESVNDLELLKNYFFKTYTETSGEVKKQIYKNISELDSRWRNIFFTYDGLKQEIFDCISVLFTGNTDNKNGNDRKRKHIKQYLSDYNDSNNRYTFDVIDQDFKFMEYVQIILTNTRKVDSSTLTIKKEDSQLSLRIENDPSSSIVKRALGLALNLSYTLVAGAIICDIIHNFKCNGSNYRSFKAYLDCVYSDLECKKSFPGLWNDSCILWKTLVMSKNFESPKKLSDVLARKCNVNMFKVSRKADEQLVQFDDNILKESSLIEEFQDWINEWKFSELDGKLKIKNLFMHLLLKYDFDDKENKLALCRNITRSYTEASIKQDLDHMDACKVDRKNKERYFNYDLANRTFYTNSLGNMMPLPIAINRGKHNTPMEETLDAYPKEGLNYWLFTSAKDLFQDHRKKVKGHYVPKEEFFDIRKEQLIDYFKRIVRNQKIIPDPSV